MESMGLGGCLVSKNILNEKGNVKWCIRESMINDIDNGWRILSDVDTDDFLSDSSNMAVCDWGTIVNIEPAIIAIYNLPIGTDIMLMKDKNIKKFVHTNTGIEI